jgi:riboflavin synthase
MFTGIIEEVGKVKNVSAGRLAISAVKTLRGMEPGGSIGVNGVCLTVTEFDDNSFSVDIMAETLKRTNLGLLHVWDVVNLERPLTMQNFLGGHLVQGHIDGTAAIASVMKQGETNLVRVEASPELMRYIVEKGFIAVDGISLTVADIDVASFTVSVVNYTLENTVLGIRKTDDIVNLEVDIIAKYVERFNKNSSPGISLDFLKEHGFIAG